MLPSPTEQYKTSFSSDRRSSLRARWDSSCRITDRPKGCGKSAWRITASSGRMCQNTWQIILCCRWNGRRFFRFYKVVERLSKVMCAWPDSFQRKCWVYLFRMNLEAVKIHLSMHTKWKGAHHSCFGRVCVSEISFNILLNGCLAII